MRRQVVLLIVLALAAPAWAQDEEETPQKRSFDLFGDEEEEDAPVEEELPAGEDPVEEEPEVVAPPPIEPEPALEAEPEPEPEPRAGPVPAGPPALVVIIADSPGAAGTAARMAQAATRALAQARGYAPMDLERALAPGADVQRDEDIRLGLKGVERGLAAFGELELETAGSELEAAINALLAHADVLDRDAKAALETGIFAYGATTLFEGQTELAESIFVALLLMSPQFEPKDETYPSNVLSRFEDLRARVEQLPTGGLTVNTNPSGADVYIDGTFRGAAPIEVGGLADGQHVIVVRRLGYKPFGTLAPVTGERTASIDVDLEVMPGADLASQLVPELAGDLQGSLQLGRELGASFLAVLKLETGLAGASVSGLWIDVARGVALGKVPASSVLADPDVASKTIVDLLATAESTPLVAAPKADPDGSSSITGAWWFWTILGAVAVAGGTAAVYAATREDRGPPSSAHIFGF